MKKNILLRTNLLVCTIIVVGFLLTAVLSYRANYDSALETIEQVSSLTSGSIYYQMYTTFSRPLTTSLTMANDSLLKGLLRQESAEDPPEDYLELLRNYLDTYRQKYGYDSVFLVSCATRRYYNFNGLDRVLTPDNPENDWYFRLLADDTDYEVVVDNDEVAGADNDITVFVNCKIHGRDGRLLGVVGVGLRIDSLQQLLAGYQETFGVNTYLTDRSGTIAISPEHTGYDGVPLLAVSGFDGAILDQILDWQTEDTPRSFWTPERKSFVVTRYLPDLEWHLVVEESTEELMHTLRTQVLATLSIILLIVAVILFIITHVIRSFNRQIISLTQSREAERRSVFAQATQEMFDDIYELDITHNRPADGAAEAYFQSLGLPPKTPYDECLRLIAARQIKEPFRQGYLNTFSPDHVQQAYENGQDSLRYEFLSSPDGQNDCWMRVTARLVRLESDGSLRMFVYRQNIDAEKRQEERLQAMARTDEMTGLLTKTATRRYIDRLLANAPSGRFAFFILDIDQFKSANDRFGHAFGDSVITSLSDLLRRAFPPGELIGRIGGDEFAVFLPVPDRQWVEQQAESLVRALRRTHTADGGDTWEISVSIGIALAPDHGRDFETLYRHADTALYETKARGRDGWTIYGGAL